ncbi:tagatose-bisphosphate aldolase [Lacticigenium naphthae]|uniref:tagatose-bisphosphate aldolase n=1 Tax=Lacticigenium naphthae TaxID=515351 RepID=UPI00040E70E9|nr:tagatose-bisphosphate aldolase [Lacticigenium naphthae]
MKYVSKNKYEALQRLSDENGIISALAIDQRGSLKKMIAQDTPTDLGDEGIKEFKKLISAELTPYSTAILLDPEYGLPATKVRDKNSGLLLAYEKTGYDATEIGRLPDLLEEWSAKRLKEQGVDAVKFLLYYDADEDKKINEFKHVYMERVGSECLGEDIPFFLEILTYDATNDDNKGKEFAKVKPGKVMNAMKEFSKPRYNVDVLKVEVPVNMNYVEGFAEADAVVYTKAEAMKHFKDQSAATDLPFIFLSAGVSAQLFQDTLVFAQEAGSTFNGVLCGRATWKNSVKPYAAEGKEKGREWLQDQGVKNITDLNKVVMSSSQPWFDKIKLEEK